MPAVVSNMPNALQLLTRLIPQPPCEVGTLIIPVLQMSKPRLRM